MSLQTTVDEIVLRVRQGRCQNEQAVSQGVVLPVLQQLGWDVFDTTLVWPEYQTGEGRADFALCHPPSKAAVFIEVKPPGRAEEGVRQALGYAFHTGVPLIVLTDGRTWSFYLPGEQGTYEDRRVYKLDLYERPPKEAEETLHRYLARSRVGSGEALVTARSEYRNRNRRGQARDAIPAAWRELVENGDDMLVELVTITVESKTGIRPDNNDVAEFLANLGGPVTVEPASGASARSRLCPDISRPPPAASADRDGTLILRGKSIHYRNAKEAMVTVLKELAREDPTFLRRCAEQPGSQGSKRRYIARSAEELYPEREDHREMCEELVDGWFVATNLNNIQKRGIIKLAAETAGLTFGRDVVVGF